MGASSSKQCKYYSEFEAKLPDLNQKVVAVTGCTSGTGLVLAKACVRKNCATVLMLNRESERATAAEKAVKAEVKDSQQCQVVTVPCDLQDFESVQKAADLIKQKYDAIDVLCNNAGVMALEDKATKDGYDVQMQTNHLSHFLLTRELFPLLQKAKELRGDARIVNHSSMSRKGGPLQAKYLEKNGGKLGGNGAFLYRGARWERYHQTKLANAVFSYVLSEKLKGSGIKALCVAPGLAQTNLQVTTGADGGMKGAMWTLWMAQSAEDGTMPLLHACFGEAENGTFWEPANGFYGLPVLKDFDKHCKDPAQQKILWETSEKACGQWSL